MDGDGARRVLLGVLMNGLSAMSHVREADVELSDVESFARELRGIPAWLEREQFIEGLDHLRRNAETCEDPRWRSWLLDVISSEVRRVQSE